MTTQDIQKELICKFEFQWKTLKKAFNDLNLYRTGKISPAELKFYFDHWGLKTTPT